MEEEIRIGSFKFWMVNNIIYCKVQSDLNDKKIDKEAEALFVKAIKRLSQGKYLPFLIDIKELNIIQSVKVFKSFSNNSQIKSLILSKTYLVDSYKLNLILSLRSFISNPVVPDAIFSKQKKAVKYCNRNNMVFNATN